MTDLEKLIRTIDALKHDQAQWRKGVELIASALGEKNPPNLSCVRLAEVALQLRTQRDALCEQLFHAISGGNIDSKACGQLLEQWCDSQGI